MSDVWMGLCAEPYRRRMEEAMRPIDKGARIRYASTACELRMRTQEASQPLGVVIGPLDGAMSSINVAAAMVRDGMAACVVLMVPKLTDDLERRALRAGVSRLVDLSAANKSGVAYLDEPLSCGVEASATPWALPSSPQTGAQGVPREEQVGPMGEVPRVTEGADEQGDLVHAPIIAFVSGRGGVGKTALVATLATAAHRWGMRVALCDLDLWFGNLYSCFGLPGPADLGMLTQQRLQEEGPMSCGKTITGDMMLWGPCSVPEYAEATYPLVGELLGQLSRSFDVVLVDTSVSFTDAVAQAVQQCDRLVLAVDNREGSEAAQTRLAALAVRLGVARTRIVRLANRCGPRGRGEPAINRADVGLETARTLRVLDGGAEVSDCLAEGKVDDLFEVGSRFADTAAAALAQLLSELGCLPNHQDARAALESRKERMRWGFGRKREAM